MDPSHLPNKGGNRRNGSRPVQARSAFSLDQRRKRAPAWREILSREGSACADVESGQRRAALLAGISSALSVQLDADSVLPQIVRLVVPRLADRCAVHLVDGGRLRLVAIADVDPERERLAWELAARHPTSMPDALHMTQTIVAGRSALMAALTEADLRQVATDPVSNCCGPWPSGPE